MFIFFLYFSFWLNSISSFDMQSIKEQAKLITCVCNFNECVWISNRSNQLIQDFVDTVLFFGFFSLLLLLHDVYSKDCSEEILKFWNRISFNKNWIETWMKSEYTRLNHITQSFPIASILLIRKQVFLFCFCFGVFSNSIEIKC